MVALHVCNVRPCPNIVSTGPRCVWHEREYQRRRGSRQQRGYGPDYQRNRLIVLERDGYICMVRRPGCTVRATTADHVVPLAEGGTNDEGNLRAACLACNSGKRDR